MNAYLSRIGTFLQYFGSTLAVAVIQVCINPMMAKNLSPEDYATIGYFSSFNLLLTPLITFFLTNFYTQRYFKVSEEERENIKATILKLSIYLSFAMAVMSIVGLFVYHVIINKASDIPFSPYAFLTVFAIPLTGLYSIKLTEYRLQRDAKNFALVTIGNGVLAAILAIAFVVIVKWGAFGRLFATILGNGLVFGIMVRMERTYLKGRLDRKVVKEVFQFCWPLAIAGMLSFFNTGFDKVLLERLGNLSELGYYSVGVQIAGYLTIFSNAVNATFQPDIYECYAKKNFKKLSMYIGLIIGSITVCATIYIVLAPYIIGLLTAGRYVYSAHYSQIIALSTITAAIYYSSSQITIAMGFTKLLMWVKIIGGVLSAISFVLLIKYYQYEGAAIGNVMSYLLYFLINVFALCTFKRKELKQK
ncbi:polysaccharide biosynthesis C-terminal domain-containing protein [Parabacteroides distasonis]|nr:polysaccharide biosynthesis C-terminal domain-containing protein [Parabacteroides distasonis]